MKYKFSFVKFTIPISTTRDCNYFVNALKKIASSYIKLLHTGLSGGGAGLRADAEETVVDLKCIGLGVGVGSPDSVKSGVDFARSRDFGRVVEVEEATLSKSLSRSMIDFTIANFLVFAFKSAADLSYSFFLSDSWKVTHMYIKL